MRGRYLVIAWTTVFLAATGTIVVRQRRAHHVQQRLNALEQEREQLLEGRAELRSRITALTSRPVLGPKVAELGLRTASDSETVDLRIRRAP
jgi:hypothetical protein